MIGKAEPWTVLISLCAARATFDPIIWRAASSEADPLALGRRKRFHQLANCVEHNSELRIVFPLQLVELTCSDTSGRRFSRT